MDIGAILVLDGKRDLPIRIVTVQNCETRTDERSLNRIESVVSVGVVEINCLVIPSTNTEFEAVCRDVVVVAVGECL